MKYLVVVETDRPGLLAEITTLLESGNVDVREISGDTVGTQVMITLRAKPMRRCHRILAEAGMRVFSSDYLLVRIDDRPGALADLSRRLANAQVDVRSIHFVERGGAHCLVALDTASPYRAGQVLSDIVVHEASRETGDKE